MLNIAKSKSCKMPRTTALLALFAALATSTTALCNEAPWTLEQDEQHVQLYTRPVSGSPFLEVKATTVIDAPIARVAEAFGTGDGCSEWRAMCKSSAIISSVSDTENYVYLVLDLPWPLSDRDMVVRSTAQIDRASKTVTVQLEPASSKHPTTDYVRAETSGEYTLKALSDTQVELTYIMHTDLGGDLLPEVINPRVAESTLTDVVALRRLAEK